MVSRRLMIALLGILCVGLAVIALAELTGSDATTPDPTGPTASSKGEVPAPDASFSMPALSNFTSVSQRPLFSPDRRPPARSADNSGAWSSFALAGIIITPDSREALVSHGKPPTISHIAEGQTIEGWTVSAIYPDHVVFRDRLSEHELRLIDKTVPQASQQPAPQGQRRSGF